VIGAASGGVAGYFLRGFNVKALAKNLVYRVVVSNPAFGGEMYSDLWVLSGHDPLGGGEFYEKWVRDIYRSADYVAANFDTFFEESWAYVKSV